MTSPYHSNPPAPMPPPPQTSPYKTAGNDPLTQFANTRMTGLLEMIRGLEERITALEVQAAQKV